ncbi:MAG TPA: flagellin lysine-N-methylase, partial [Terriglobales bacterium]
CDQYPRVTRRIDGLPEMALILACPEAARLVLLNPCLLPELAAEGPSRYQPFLHATEEPVRVSGNPYQFLWEIRSFTARLLTDRTYPLWQRIFLLGMFSRRLREITVVGQLELVPRVLCEYAELITTERLRPAMDGIPLRSAQQLAAVIEILNCHLTTVDPSHVRLRECVRDFLQGIRWDDRTGIEGAAIAYERACNHYYLPFMQQRPHLLENYLLNHVFRTRFPYGCDLQGNPHDVVTEYLLMCVLFACIKGLLIGTAGHCGESFGEPHVIKVVQSFAKAVEQSPKFVLSRYGGFADADGMALLLKN